METAVFRIVPECLTNIRRHSESSTADVRICQFVGGFALEVKGIGRGIPAAKLARLCPSDCREWASGNAGTNYSSRRSLRILPEGKGTTVKVEIPMRVVAQPGFCSVRGGLKVHFTCV